MRSDADTKLLPRLCALLADVSGARPDTLSAESTPENTPGWDSVTNLSFISAVEEEFGVTIKTSDALKLRCLGDMARLLRARAEDEGAGVERAARGA